MKDRNFRKEQQRRKRANRTRRRVRGTAERPRLCVHRTLKHTYVQIIDDEAGRTLCAVSTREKTVADGLSGKGGNRDAATRIGEEIAKRAAEKGLKKVAFDRGSYKYHGRVKALADAARKGGLDF
jgi:large subunit ribosomal protein L18